MKLEHSHKHHSFWLFNCSLLRYCACLNERQHVPRPVNIRRLKSVARCQAHSDYTRGRSLGDVSWNAPNKDYPLPEARPATHVHPWFPHTDGCHAHLSGTPGIDTMETDKIIPSRKNQKSKDKATRFRNCFVPLLAYVLSYSHPFRQQCVLRKRRCSPWYINDALLRLLFLISLGFLGDARL